MAEDALSVASQNGEVRAATPWIVRATAAIAWAVSAYCFGVLATRAAAPTLDLGDGVFWIVLGAGSAYLGMAITRRAEVAWQLCVRIAFGCGVVNTALLALLAIDFFASASELPLWGPPGGASRVEFFGLLVALQAVPWLLFVGLRGPSVREWIATAPAA